MSCANPYRLRHAHRHAARRSLVVAATAGLITLGGGQAFGADTPGETFVFDWAETMGSNVGLTGMVDLTLGAASTESGFFQVSSFDVTSAGGFCGICTPKTENLGGMLFDATTNGLVGDITGSYLNSKGKTHTFTLVTTDLPSGGWTFADTGPGGTATSMGTYTTKTVTTPVDEPETLLLLIPAIGGLAVSLRRRRRAAAS